MKLKWIVIAIIVLVVIGTALFLVNSQNIGESLTEQLQQIHQSKRGQH
jgi:uncharacterized protein YxeA